MSARRWKKLAILNKIETAYRTDSTPTAADALIATNVTFTPLEGDEVSRDLMLPYLGNQGVVLAGIVLLVAGAVAEWLCRVPPDGSDTELEDDHGPETGEQLA